MNCGSCEHWNLKDSNLRQYGFGRCQVEPNPLMRAGKSTSPQNICRLGKYAKAEVKVIQRREKEMGAIL